VTFTRAIVIVLDSVGIGELPDAVSYGDEGSDTLGNIAKQVTLGVPTLRALGLNRVAAIGANEWNDSAVGAVGRMAEASAGHLPALMPSTQIAAARPQRTSVTAHCFTSTWSFSRHQRTP